MDKNAIKTYAVWARNELRDRVSKKLDQYEITASADSNADSVRGKLLTKDEKSQRAKAIEKVKEKGIDQVIEEVAYTWFNRFSALRFMEVNNYLPTRIRVFTDENNEFKPQILSEAIHMELDGLDMEKVYDLKERNNNDELFKYLIITQCNALSKILPGMFQKIADYTELLFPDNLLREGSVIEQMIKKIPQEDFNTESGNGQVEILGWLYQYYISEKHEEVVDPLHGKVVKKEEVPAATQLFTTDWVVRYIIDNSVGRYWIERNPESKLKDDLQYFVMPKDGNLPVVNEKVIPQDITVFDPCVGSGHFLVYAFEVLIKIYVEYGYTEREAAKEIVENNLFGLDIDDRAVQLAYFAVMMKARQYDRRFLTRGIQPNVYEIIESNGVDKASVEYFYANDINLKKDVDAILDTLRDAKEYGSILQMPDVDYVKINDRFNQIDSEISMYKMYLLGEFRTLIQVAEVIGKRYAVVATNPPYLNKYDSKLKIYINDHFRDYSGDLFSVFMIRNFEYCKRNGYSGFMTPFVWMFIQTYEKTRRYILGSKELTSIIQMEYSAYEEATVPICSFVMKNGQSDKKALCFRLSEFRGGMDVQKNKVLEALKDTSCGYFYETNQKDLLEIPGCPIAYWASRKVIESFNNNCLSEDCETKKGLATSDNNRFLRLWFEISNKNVSYECTSNEMSKELPVKWFPHNKGGDFRRWYGNNSYVINWENDGFEIRNYRDDNGKLLSRPQNLNYNFKQAITWSKITSGDFSARICRGGFLFDDAAAICHHKDINHLYYVLGFLNSKCCQEILRMLNPTINLQIGDIGHLPIKEERVDQVVDLVKKAVEISKKDWDSFETSWDFKRHPLVCFKKDEYGKNHTISECFDLWKEECEVRFSELQRIEEQINSLFIEIYGLEDEINSTIEDKMVTVRKADLKRDVRGLMSYAVGCMFGRYSLEEEGLQCANEAIDEYKYFSDYVPDDDAIIPICNDEYFQDDVTERFVRFIKIVYGNETLEDNLLFIANAIGGKGSAREIIRNYFINDFFVDHCNTYAVTGSGKRPIYWLFDSGKKNGFKCLVYMHRYKPDTIARIRTDYVHEQQSRYRTAIAGLERQIADASTSERVRLNKRLSTLKDQAEETRKYEEKIHHLADQMISIDLDDGVKHNYEIFKDVLAKIK